jgi:3-hydroxyisobutyrate dehydrogenase-like beta-hydroxyacid dehydrogenase
MALKTIAIMSPGDMGHAVGRALGESGYDVMTCLAGRSERTRELARKGNIRDVPSLDDMVREADLILSILVPSQAADIASAVAEAIRNTGASPYYAECNAISPNSTRRVGSIITNAGGKYIDGGIIGGPPGRGSGPRFYVSGEHANVMDELDGKGIWIKYIGDEVGRASGMKMCYASLTKGTSALQVAVLTTAESLGLSKELRAEFESSQQDTLQRMEGLGRLPANAHRWIGEMEEIAATYDDAGVTPHFHEGAAEIFRLLARTPFADETPETIDRNRTVAETIEVVAQYLPNAVESAD